MRRVFCSECASQTAGAKTGRRNQKCLESGFRVCLSSRSRKRIHMYPRERNEHDTWLRWHVCILIMMNNDAHVHTSISARGFGSLRCVFWFLLRYVACHVGSFR